MSQGNLNTSKTKDAKKDTKKPAAKGAQVEADKNNPKPIEIEYPEIESEKDYVIVERTFQVKNQPEPSKRKNQVKS